MNNRTAFESIQDAILGKETELAKILVEAYAKFTPNALVLRNAKKKTLLQLAVENNLAEVADPLFRILQSDTDILFGEDISGGNLLFQTVQHGMLELTKKIVAVAEQLPAQVPGHRIWLKADNINCTLLHAAVYTRQSPEMLLFLLDTAKDDTDFYKLIHQQTLDNIDIPAGSTALHIACSKNQPALAELLIRYGARLDITNDAGETPLEVIPKQQHDAFILSLAEHGALLGQKVNAVVGQKLSELAETNDMLLVGVTVTVNNLPLSARTECMTPRSAANFISDQTVDALILHCDRRWEQLKSKPDCTQLYYHAITCHKDLLTLITKKIKHAPPGTYDLSELAENKFALPQATIDDLLSTRISRSQLKDKKIAATSSTTENSADNNATCEESTSSNQVYDETQQRVDEMIDLLIQDQQMLTHLIASFTNLETNLRARPTESIENKITVVLIAFVVLAVLVTSETVVLINHNKWIEIRDALQKQSGHSEEKSHASEMTVLFGMLNALPVSVAFLCVMFVILSEIPTRLWRKSPIVNHQEWESLLNEARDVLKQLQFLREKETRDSSHDQNSSVTHLHVEPNFSNEFEQHIAALANSLPITVAIPALSSLKDDLIKLHNRLKVTQKPFSLFSHPAKNTDAIVEIPSDDDEFEPEGDEEEVPLLRRNRFDDLDDERPPARPK